MSSPTGSTRVHLSPEGHRIGKSIRRRTRASMRTPPTLVSTNAENFRVMVQHFTAGPTDSTSLVPGTHLGGPNLVLGFEERQPCVNPDISLTTPPADVFHFVASATTTNDELGSSRFFVASSSYLFPVHVGIRRRRSKQASDAQIQGGCHNLRSCCWSHSITAKGKPWKARRRTARQKKAVRIFPRPTAGPLRPIVHGQTLKYNMKLRAGRGFTLEELKAAGISKKLAPTIGIAVDHRRKNRSLEGLQANVQRLKTYKAKLVVFPRRARKFKAGDSTAEELATATQVQGSFMPISREKPSVELVKVTEEMKSFKAYNKLRVERMNERHIGARLKKAAEAEKEDKKKVLETDRDIDSAASEEAQISSFAVVVTMDDVEALQCKHLAYDKARDEHLQRTPQVHGCSNLLVGKNAGRRRRAPLHCSQTNKVCQ
ncbi:hypothetical protein V6N12_072889 [Hibiscus sabdariffa]|uniref:60S ribosomal protein L13 n=1 Tax=Hibiscus sabdariffa TaxID=183260 RepID=A0ABR2B4I5_9ROSI